MSLFFFQAEDGIRDLTVTGVQTCALPIFTRARARSDQATTLRPPSGRYTLFRPPPALIPAPLASTTAAAAAGAAGGPARSEERRVGNEGRSRWSPDHLKKKISTMVTSAL